MHKGETIRKMGSTTMMIILYVIFFAAQLFSVNPDQPGSHNTVLVFGARQVTKQHIVIPDKDADNHFTSEICSLRLNKRFQVSEVFLFIPELIQSVPSIPFIQKSPGCYQAGFVPSPHNRFEVLRGPPAVMS